MIDSTKSYKLEKENRELKKEIEILRSGNDITKIINDNVVFLKYQKEQQEMIKSLEKELQHYKLAVHEISRYINAYYPYFTETQEQNNKKIATIIHELGAGDVIWQ